MEIFEQEFLLDLFPLQQVRCLQKSKVIKMKSPALVPISVHDQKPSLEIGEKALGVKLLQLECCSFLPTRYSFGQSKAYLVSVKDYILNCFCRSICHQETGGHSLQEYLVKAD